MISAGKAIAAVRVRALGHPTGLARANNELRATGELLANTSRLTERERISRELHDTLGHHLTALSLNLEAASHLARERFAMSR